jgi:uncharacterized Ntn-hydrolase superfamily protein
MTWSILARDGQGRFGVAIASRFFAVGALCVHTRRGVGALSTQALMNPLYGPDGMDLLAHGHRPEHVLQALTIPDEGREHRQVHLLPATGTPVAWTGNACVPWCGHYLGEDFSVAGNMLAGPQVLEATAQAFMATRGSDLADRLVAALAAGEEAGGDKRGKQAAALRIQADEDWPQLDLRVDDHAEPVQELARLLRKSGERYQPFMACLPGRHDRVGLVDREEIEARIGQWTQGRGGLH